VEEACASLDALREAVRHAFAGFASGEAKALPKANLDLAPGHFFQAMVAADSRMDLAAVKWVAVAPVDGSTAIHSSIMLSRRSTGELLATMDADPITAARTAAMSAIAAQHLARPDSRSIAFIGCGTQARSHLPALARVLPNLKHVLAYSRRADTAAVFADEARLAGFDAEVVEEPRAAIERADVVVSGVPIGGGSPPFLDASWLKAGAFVTAVDLARPWLPESYGQFDIIATDERHQSEQLVLKGRMPVKGPFDADLSSFAKSQGLLRATPSQKVLFVFAGHALGDLAAAGLVYRHAQHHLGA
jgi:ornithine cyclodeaminase/alanine dehydrogenase-like protein (mu-crystallin family)